jgi:hypothetical protein
MRTAILALIGAISASQIVIPDVEWNTAKVQQVEKTLMDYGQKAEIASKADERATLNDLSLAYSRYRVGEIVSFGKNLKPIAQLNVELLDDLTVTGNCNKEAATTCINEFLWGRSSKPHMETCFNQAGCTSKFSTMTNDDKQALARRYETSIRTVE